MNNNSKLNTSKNICLSDYLVLNLEKLFRLHRCSYQDVANVIGVSKSQISRIMSSETKNPGVEIVLKLASYFSVSLDMLFSESFAVEQEETVHRNKAPVIPWSEIVQSRDIGELVRTNKSNNYIHTLTGSHALLCATISQPFMQPRFLLNTIIVLDLSTPVRDGDIVLVRYNADDSLSMKELFIDGPEYILAPLRPGAQSEKLDYSVLKIVGSIIEAHTKYN